MKVNATIAYAGPVTLGQGFRLRRESAHLTQEELARETKIGVRTIRAIEQGDLRKTDFATIECLARALGFERLTIDMDFDNNTPRKGHDEA